MDKKLLDILACPKCKGPVRLDDIYKIICPSCALVYPVRDGIPIMLIDEATALIDQG